MEVKERINYEADRCVKCGICLPHCPTYKLFHNESESPRGRIALIQALANGDLESSRAYEHLDHCLNCLACEKSCPSSVNYGELIDLSRQLSTEQKNSPPPRLTSLISKLPYSRFSYPLYWTYRRLGLRMIARALLGKRFRRIDNLLAPNLHPAALRTHSQTDKSTIRVGLFTGCIARVTERAPLQATIQVLEQLGVEVIIPKTQGCCGALHQHDGHPGEARRLATQNQSAFNLQPLDAIIYTASGCGAQLEAVDAGFSAPVMEVCHFLNRYEWPDTATLTPCDKEVQIHSPCSLNHKSEVARILEKIPQLKAAELLHQDCCGAGGSLVLKHPALADRLRNRAIAKLPNKSSPWLVTTNSGCAMHLRAGLKEAQVDTQVLHPIELIARQLTIR